MRKGNRSKEYNQLALTAMHGILTACASPQYYDRLAAEAKQQGLDISSVIADKADAIAHHMLAQRGRSCNAH